MRPIIGISPDFHPGTKKDAIGGNSPTYHIPERYVKALEDAGAFPIMLPYTHLNTLKPLLTKQLHGVMMIGSGSDLDPEYYGEPPICSYPIMSKERATFDIGLTRAAWKANLPLLGICGGMQTMNVALGGTLIQDIEEQLPHARNHKPDTLPSRAAHSISVMKKSLLEKIVGRRSFRVNSCHHQALGTISKKLSISAISPDGIVEAIEAPTRKFFLGVQWHPEHRYQRSEPDYYLFKAFVTATRHHATFAH